jgi:hypothetical protein
MDTKVKQDPYSVYDDENQKTVEKPKKQGGTTNMTGLGVGVGAGLGTLIGSYIGAAQGAGGGLGVAPVGFNHGGRVYGSWGDDALCRSEFYHADTMKGIGRIVDTIRGDEVLALRTENTALKTRDMFEEILDRRDTKAAVAQTNGLLGNLVGRADQAEKDEMKCAIATLGRAVGGLGEYNVGRENNEKFHKVIGGIGLIADFLNSSLYFAFSKL